VETPQGLQTIGILVAPAGRLWRARILTYPNLIWTIPGGGGSMKFAASTPRDAERQAIEFVNAHCAANGFVRRELLATVDPGPIDPEVARDFLTYRTAATSPPPRKQRALSVSFVPPTVMPPTVTVNVSETGVFISTPRPLDPGAPVRFNLDLESYTLGLHGSVVWSRPHAEVGRPAGMGVKLTHPPALYVGLVRNLP
jgi:Tfp pilus assembly protein PilZ